MLAAGARERPLVFADNDRSGIMLAPAVRRYVRRHAVLPGGRAVVFTTSDSAYATAPDLLAAGAQLPAIVDTKANPPARLVEQVRAAGSRVHPGSAVAGTSGSDRIPSVRIAGLDERGSLAGEVGEVPCDLLAVCGGWKPAVELFGQAGGKLRWDDWAAAFVPDGSSPVEVVGAARGTGELTSCFGQGFAAGAAAAAATGFDLSSPLVPAVAEGMPHTRIGPLWLVTGASGDPVEWDTHFVDLPLDSTAPDVWRTIGAGMRSAEHVKRYTTIGTGSDEGKTSG